MALERRAEKVYYYRSRRVGNHVVKEYGGCGSFAILLAQSDHLTRQTMNLEKREWREALIESKKELAGQRKWLKAVDDLVAEALRQSGWHQARRQWRKKRGMVSQDTLSISSLPRVDIERVPAVPKLDAEAINRNCLLWKTIDTYLDNPAATAIWGNSGRFLLAKWSVICAGENKLTQKMVLESASNLREQLAGTNPTALVQLLAERIVLCRLFVNVANMQLARSLGISPPSLISIDHQRVNLANRKLESACRTLAKVKRISLPEARALASVMPPVLGCSYPESA